MRGLAFIALTATAALLATPSANAVDYKARSVITDTCGGLLSDYVATAAGTADTGFTGTLAAAGNPSGVTMTLTPQVFKEIPNGSLRAELASPAINDEAVTAFPVLLEDFNGRGLLRFETPWGATVGTPGCTGAGTRVTSLTGEISTRGVSYSYRLTRP
ncbi:hypothetical protein ACFWBN_34590 [Streptomyces sp. NPDC059989]|uniref:hypothetical protein n=1 Tax=Streptomyces sp. NPDC059989 TaxID=3347026 RepID=UPI0036B3C5A0